MHSILALCTYQIYYIFLLDFFSFIYKYIKYFTFQLGDFFHSFMKMFLIKFLFKIVPKKKNKVLIEIACTIFKL